jgi:post-segregation antitoxin (ccd killing protein)
MQASYHMGSKKSTYLYLNREVVETAKKLGLNVSRVSENALKEAMAD